MLRAKMLVWYITVRSEFENYVLWNKI